jgi:hypothetical protein
MAPNITGGGCPNSSTTYVRLYLYSGGSWCLAGKGTYYPYTGGNWSNEHEVTFCPGNNYGSFGGYNENGTYKTFSFWPGQWYWFYNEPGGVFQITWLTITGWSGSKACPTG